MPNCEIKTGQQCEEVVDKVAKRVPKEVCTPKPERTCRDQERKYTTTRKETKCSTVYTEKCS